jgi:hypothetical protein
MLHRVARRYIGGGLGQLRALQNGGPQQDGRRRLGIVEDGEESFQGTVGG